MTELIHAKLSASGSHRWLNCPASARMEEGFPDTTSSFAEEGSAAHHLAEICLREEKNTDEFLECQFDEYPEHPVDVEMVESVQLYLDYVRNLDGELLVEQRVDFSPWVPEGFGTSDAIVMHEGVATVVDLKYGKGVRVDAEDNTQAMLYALGALNEYDFIYECDLFRVVIVQPRLDHISEWEIKRSDLLEWAENTVKPKAELTLQEEAPFNPGEKQCHFCKANGTCKALAEHALQIAADGFEAVEVPLTVKDITKLSNEEIAVLLPQLKTLTKWVSALETHAQAEAEKGEKFPNHKVILKNGQTSRSWKNDDSAKRALNREFKKLGKEEPTSNPISPAQAEKIIGKTNPLFDKHVVKTTGDAKYKLVHESAKGDPVEINPTEDFEEVA
ncbi:Phage protein [gamma proteobacterium IMCC1989]|nr:Phage protein [gamma proteobacterium IMCC1989]